MNHVPMPFNLKEEVNSTMSTLKDIKDIPTGFEFPRTIRKFKVNYNAYHRQVGCILLQDKLKGVPRQI